MDPTLPLLCKDRHGDNFYDNYGSSDQQAQLTSSSVVSEKTRVSLTPQDCSVKPQQIRNIHNENVSSSGDSLEDTTKVSEKGLSEGANVAATIEKADRKYSLDSYRKYSRNSSYIKDLRATHARMNFAEFDYDATMKSANEEVSYFCNWKIIMHELSKCIVYLLLPCYNILCLFSYVGESISKLI